MEDGGPSVTARRVAAHRLGFARVATDYGDPAADEALAADVAAGRAAPANRMHDYLAARTSFFDRTVTSALGRGVEQVVVGAAGVRRPRVPVRQARRPLVRGRPSRDPEGQARAPRAARHRRFPRAVRCGRLHPRPGGRPAARGRTRPGHARPVPARRGGRLSGACRPGGRPRPVPANRRARQPPGHQRVAVPPARRRRPRPIPGHGGRAGGTGQIHVRGQRGRSPAGADRLADRGRSGRRPAGSRPARAPPRGRPAPGRRGPHKRGPHKRGPHKRGPHKRGPRAGVGPATTATPATPAAPRRSAPFGAAVPGAGRVHDRVRQRGRTPPAAPHYQPRDVR